MARYRGSQQGRGLWRGIVNRYKRFNAWYKGLYAGKRWYTKAFYAMCTLLTTIILLLVAVNTNFLWLFGKSPSLHEIMEPRPYNASIIYSADDKVIGKYYRENRTPVKYEEVDTMFYKILIDTEDERFYNHWGVDFHGLAGAAKDFIVHRKARGASTITQQLVKNMFRMRTSEYTGGLLCYIPGVRMIIMKMKEWILATEIEAFYDKERILEMYANTVDFGNQAFGIKTAAKTYFDTTPDKLKIEQSAMLVGVLKGTSVYNPLKNPKNCLERRNVVLHNALEHDDITQEQYDKLSSTNLNLKYSPETEMESQCPYFRMAVVEEMRNWCEKNDVDFYRDGLEIHTSIDTRMQRFAEQAVKEQMRTVQQSFNNEWGERDCWVDEHGRVIPGFVEEKAKQSDYYKQLMAKYNEDPDSVDYYMNKKRTVQLFDFSGGHTATMSALDSVRYMLHRMHCGFVAMDPVTGEVKAWVGDVDYKTWQYDNVRAVHQPGSTFKLFVYSAAIKEGKRPCDTYMDSPLSTGLMGADNKPWEPKNANGKFSYQNLTLRAALARSNNIIAVKVGNDVGIPKVAQTAKDMGITSPLDETPSLCLGSSDVSLMDLVNCYSTVVDNGQYKKPVLVTRIYRTNKNGVKEEIYNSRAQDDPKQALSHDEAYTIRRMLEAVCCDAGGTGGGINRYVSNVGIGGKTGTSNNYTDAWFVAITPRLVCGAWVGGQYRQIHFRSAQGQGSRAALPIVGAFLQRVLGNRAFNYLHKEFPVDHELDRQVMACSNFEPEEDTNQPQPEDRVDRNIDTVAERPKQQPTVREKVLDDIGPSEQEQQQRQREEEFERQGGEVPDIQQDFFD